MLANLSKSGGGDIAKSNVVYISQFRLKQKKKVDGCCKNCTHLRGVYLRLSCLSVYLPVQSRGFLFVCFYF